ncbi:MAG TPA: hypothetical protein VHS59_09340 [Bacillota bacterium]|nr:hypothetical protein [Bacillota bacterium]
MEMFIKGQGDVLIASEFSAINALKKYGDEIEMVIPPYSVMADLTVYKMEKNIGFGDEEVIDAFIDFLYTEEAQEYVAEYGFRPTNSAVLSRHPEFRPLEQPFHLNYLGEATELKRNLILGDWLTINNDIAAAREESAGKN